MANPQLTTRLNDIIEAIMLVEATGVQIDRVNVAGEFPYFDIYKIADLVREEFPKLNVIAGGCSSAWTIRTIVAIPGLQLLLITPSLVSTLRKNSLAKQNPTITPIDTSVLEENPLYGMF